MNRFYEIKVYDGMELLFEREEPVGRIGERRLRDLLQALVVKRALTLEEIVDGHLNQNARGYRALPEVRQDRRGEGHHLMGTSKNSLAGFDRVESGRFDA